MSIVEAAIGSAKFMSGTYEKVKQDETVCLICDRIQMLTIMLLPILTPIAIIYMSSSPYGY